MALGVSALLAGGCVDINVGTWRSDRGSRAPTTTPPPPPPSPDEYTAPDAVTPPPPSVPPTSSGSGTPTGSGQGWSDVVRKVAGQVFLDAENGAVFYAFDTLAYPGESVDLVARLRTDKDLQGVAGATIAFRRGDWTAGRITTNADGVATMRWTPPKAGHYSFVAEIVAVAVPSQRDMLGVRSPLLVAARDKRTAQVVVDLDHTVVDSNFFMVLVGGGKPMAGSVAALNRIAKQYGVVYLTHRPDLLTRKTKSWLASNGYPSGPLLTAEMQDVLDSGKFKSAKLASLRKEFPNTSLGIGDKLSDAQAYVDSGMTAMLLPHYDEDDWKEMRKLAAQLRVLRGQGRLHVVDNWTQVEQGLSGAKTFSPESYAQQLELRAERVRAEEDD